MNTERHKIVKVSKEILSVPYKIGARILKIGSAVILDLRDKARGDIQEVMDQVNTAEHEMGHAAISMLNNHEITRITRNKLSKRMNAALGRRQGGVIRTLPNSKPENMKIPEVVGHIMDLLAGYAAVSVHDSGGIPELGFLSNQMFKRGAGDDYTMAENLLEKIDRYKDRRTRIIAIIFRRLQEFFKNPEVRKMMEILTDMLIEKPNITKRDGEKTDVNGILEKHLQDRGVNLEAIRRLHRETIKSSLDEIDGLVAGGGFEPPTFGL